MTLFKKIIIISLIFNFLLFSIFIIYKKIDKKTIKVENYVVKIIKKAEIIDNNKNPSGLFLQDTNIGENILNGFFISPDTVITAYHGTNGDNAQYEIKDIYSNNYQGNIKYFDKQNDIALIDINNNIQDFKEIRANNKYDIGDKVFSISYNNGISIKYGNIIDIKDNKIYTDIVFDSGESGSPLFNESGRILAINLEVDIEKNIGISHNLNFLDEKKDSY